MQLNRPRRLFVDAILFVLYSTIGLEARGEDRYFVGITSGGFANWSDASNWTDASVPTATDKVWILHFDERDRDIHADYAAPASIAVDQLLLGNSGGGLTTFYQTGDLTAAKEILDLGQIQIPTLQYIPKAHAVHVQNGGTSNVGWLLLADYNGYQTPSSARYVLNAGTLNAGWLDVGYGGHGTFEQNGGANNVTGLYLSSIPNTRSTYTLNNGTLTAGLVAVGWSSAGTFIHTGGVHTTDQLSLGQTLGGSGSPGGTYILSGEDAVLIADTELIARAAAGTFIQSAGHHIVQSYCAVGWAYTAHYHLRGGTFAVISAMDIGRVGPATFDHTGGMVTVGTESAPGTLTIGVSSVGTYALSSDSAVLQVWGTEYVGYDGHGWFDHTAGTHRVSDTLDIGAYSSQYHLDGGELEVGSSTLVGVFGSGSFGQTAGAFATPLLQIGSGGSFTWGGGSLSVSSLSLAGQMTLTQGSGRTLVVERADIDNATAKLDLADNRLILDYPGDSPGLAIEEIREDLRDGALFSSIADHSKRLGYADNRLLHWSSFAGQAFPADDYTQLLVMHTYAGDANLDGLVNVADLSALATSWQQPAVWTGGDFDYDGIVNVGDLGILAGNWQKGVTPAQGDVPQPSLAEALAVLGLPDVTVPEPGGMVVVAAAGLLAVGGRQRSAPD